MKPIKRNKNYLKLFLIACFFIYGCGTIRYKFSNHSFDKNAYYLDKFDTIKTGKWFIINQGNAQFLKYKKNKINGKSIIYYSSGEIGITHYKNGVRNGVRKEYTIYGFLWMYGIYKNDSLIYHKVITPRL